MNRQKIRSLASIILFLLLAVFFIVTFLLGFQNNPAVRFAPLIALVLIGLCALWSIKPTSSAYQPQKDYRAMLLLGLLAVLPRGLWIASVHTIQISDFALYYRLASVLADGAIKYQSYIRLYPHVIAYPYVLSILFRLFGNSALIAQIFNVILYLGIVLAIFLLAAQFLDRRFAILAAVIVALWPSTIFHTTTVSTEALFTLLLLLCIGLFYSIRNMTRLPIAIVLFGLLGAGAAMIDAVRPFGPLFLIAVFIYYFVFVSPESSGLKPWILKLVLFACVCLGYLVASNFIHYLIVRNVQGTVAKTFLGYSMLVGSNINSGGGWNEGDSALQARIYQDGKIPPDKVNQILLGYAIERIRSSPKAFLNLQLVKNQAMWQDDRFAIDWSRAYLDGENPGLLSPAFLERIAPISNYYYYTILICCILGSVIGIWKRETGLITFVGLILLGTILIFIFTEVKARYHYYVLPLFALLAVYGLAELNQAYQKRRQSKA